MKNKMGFFETLKTHIFIEFFYRHDKGVLIEHLKRGKKTLLNEKYGVFDGCEKLARQIIDTVSEFDFDEKIIRVRNCNFINSILIIKDSEIDALAGYYTQSDRNENGQFDPIIIFINDNEISDKNMLPSIMHELTHAYQDYNLENKGKNMLTVSTDSNFFENLFSNANDEGLGLIRDCLYYFDLFERGAFIATIVGDIRNNRKTFTNIGDICDFLKENEIIKTYTYLFDYIDRLEEITDIKEQRKIFDYVKKYSDFKFNTYNQMVKILKRRAYNIRRKFNTIIPKIAYDNLNRGAFRPNLKN